MTTKTIYLGFLSIIMTFTLLVGCNWKDEPKDLEDQQYENNESDLQRGRQ